MKTPADKRIVMSFHSELAARVDWRWRATLTFEPGSTDDSLAKIEIADLDGNPIPKGSFEFAGQKLPVKDGRAAIRCKDFVKGKHEKGIWLLRKDKDPVMGGSTFG